MENKKVADELHQQRKIQVYKKCEERLTLEVTKNRSRWRLLNNFERPDNPTAQMRFKGVVSGRIQGSSVGLIYIRCDCAVPRLSPYAALTPY